VNPANWRIDGLLKKNHSGLRRYSVDFAKVIQEKQKFFS
jgi:hypothetical protein